MFLVAFGIFDVLVGIILALSPGMPMVASGFIMLLGILALLKSLYSIGASGGSVFAILGVIDLIACVFLFMSYAGWVFGFFLYMGVIMLLKGLYSFVLGLSK